MQFFPFLLLITMLSQHLCAEVVDAHTEVFSKTDGQKRIDMSVNNTYLRLTGPIKIKGVDGAEKIIFGNESNCMFMVPEGTRYGGSNVPYSIDIGIFPNDGRLFLQSEKYYKHNPSYDIIEEVKTKTGLVYNMKQSQKYPEGKKNPHRLQRRREYIIDGEYIYVVQVTWHPENETYPPDLKKVIQGQFFSALSSIKINGKKYEGIAEIQKLKP